MLNSAKRIRKTRSVRIRREGNTEGSTVKTLIRQKKTIIKSPEEEVPVLITLQTNPGGRGEPTHQNQLIKKYYSRRQKLSLILPKERLPK